MSTGPKSDHGIDWLTNVCLPGSIVIKKTISGGKKVYSSLFARGHTKITDKVNYVVLAWLKNSDEKLFFLNIKSTCL